MGVRVIQQVERSGFTAQQTYTKFTGDLYKSIKCLTWDLSEGVDSGEFGVSNKSLNKRGS